MSERIDTGSVLRLEADSCGYMDDKLTVDAKLSTGRTRPSHCGASSLADTDSSSPVQARYSDGGRKRDPRSLGKTVHVEVAKLNPKLATIARKDFTLDFEGDFGQRMRHGRRTRRILRAS